MVKKNKQTNKKTNKTTTTATTTKNKQVQDNVLCVVYCQLNGVAHTDNYPIPQAESLIDCFGEAQDLT